tara:strand:+ start:317 stop:568 length:252 start_codon:yes stop_codon:yes gene_type:complete
MATIRKRDGKFQVQVRRGGVFSKITGLKTVRHKSEWVTARQSYKRAMEFKTAERDYYLDAVSRLKINRSARYMRYLHDWEGRF